MSDNFQANQYQADPRQQEFLINYLDPTSETWSNALQSALKAGYSQEYAESITHKMPDWLAEKVGDDKLLKKAYKNLEMALEGLLDDVEGKKDIQWKASQAVLKGIEKNKWSERQEHTGKDGKDLMIQFSNNYASEQTTPTD